MKRPNVMPVIHQKISADPTRNNALVNSKLCWTHDAVIHQLLAGGNWWINWSIGHQSKVVLDMFMFEKKTYVAITITMLNLGRSCSKTQILQSILFPYHKFWVVNEICPNYNNSRYLGLISLFTH